MRLFLLNYCDIFYYFLLNYCYILYYFLLFSKFANLWFFIRLINIKHSLIFIKLLLYFVLIFAFSKIAKFVTFHYILLTFV